MKHLTLISVAAVALTFAACGDKSAKETADKAVDTVETAAQDIEAEITSKIESEKPTLSMESKPMPTPAQKFMMDNIQKPGVKRTDSGLQYKVLTAGDGGKMPTRNSSVVVHYEGKLIDGTVFDSSYKRGEPIEFGVTQVIAGWTEALQLMQIGDVWEVYIPPELGYGARGAGDAVPPNAAMIFKVELLGINN